MSSELVRRAEDACRAATTTKRLRERIVALLRPQLAFDGHIFALTDPVTRVAISPHADLPMLPWPRLPEMIRWRYLSVGNRWDRLLDSPGPPATSLLTSTTDPAESPAWSHVQRDLGVRDTATVAFGDRYGAWGFLELWRSTQTFGAAEIAVLAGLAPTVTAGLRAALARTFDEPSEPATSPGPAVVVLGPDLQVRSQTKDAAAALLRLLPPDEPMPPIPAAAYNSAAALIAQEEGLPIGEPWARVQLGGNRWVTVKASRLGVDTTGDIAVSIEPTSAELRLNLFARVNGLSGRETEVLTLLGNGLSSAEIAGRLVISEHTANDHVKAVLAKAGARTRQALAARALGAG